MYCVLSKLPWDFEQVANMLVSYSPCILLLATAILCYGVCSLESRRKELWFEETLGSAGWRLQFRGRRLGQMRFPTHWASVDSLLMRIRPLATKQDVNFQAWFGYLTILRSGILAVRRQGAVFPRVLLRKRTGVLSLRFMLSRADPVVLQRCPKLADHWQILTRGDAQAAVEYLSSIEDVILSTQGIRYIEMDAEFFVIVGDRTGGEVRSAILRFGVQATQLIEAAHMPDPFADAVQNKP